MKKEFCEVLKAGGTKCESGNDPSMYGIQDFINSLQGRFETGTFDANEEAQKKVAWRIDYKLNERARMLDRISDTVKELFLLIFCFIGVS